MCVMQSPQLQGIFLRVAARNIISFKSFAGSVKIHTNRIHDPLHYTVSFGAIQKMAHTVRTVKLGNQYAPVVPNGTVHRWAPCAARGPVREEGAHGVVRGFAHAVVVVRGVGDFRGGVEVVRGTDAYDGIVALSAAGNEGESRYA